MLHGVSSVFYLIESLLGAGAGVEAAGGPVSRRRRSWSRRARQPSVRGDVARAVTASSLVPTGIRAAAGFHLLAGAARTLIIRLLRRLMLALGAGLTLLRAFDVAACGDAFIAAHQQLLLLRLATTGVRVVFTTFTTRGARPFPGGFGSSFASARQCAALGAATPAALAGTVAFRLPDHQQLADMLDRRGIQPVADLVVDGDAVFAVVAEHADLDQLMRVEVDLRFRPARRRSSPSAPTSTTGLSA